MPIDQESFNTNLYKLLKTRGYKPVPKDAKNQRTDPNNAEVFNFTFTKDGKEYGDAWVTIDDASNVVLYYSNEQEESPSGKSPGLDYDDSWSGLKRHLKQWSMNKQLTFELRNKDELGDDMAQRDYVKKKEKMNETKEERSLWDPSHCPTCDTRLRKVLGSSNAQCDKCMKIVKVKLKKHPKQMAEGYHPMGKKASYNDNIPAVKIILQHNRQIEEGEQRYRNIAKIFLENQDGERFLAPTTRPGIAQVYARHIAEGGVPNDERWNHIKSICEEYSKMAGFVRATKNKQFNESAQSLVNEGINHYQSLRETLGKLRGHRGYNQYFESWTPALMEDDVDGTQINELFVQETVDPRIESVMPILSRLYKKTVETPVKEVKELEQWADSIVEGEQPEMIDQFKNELRKSKKQNNATRYYYYQELIKMMPDAAVSYEKFINSWAGEEWFKKNESKIKKFADESNHRFLTNFKVEYPRFFDNQTLEEDSDTSPVESSILNRIAMVRTDLLKHGIDKVMDAVKEVAYNVGDVDEIGSSDVSGWIRQVEGILGHKEETLEGIYDRRLGHHVPRDGKVFSQDNHPRVETCEYCGEETGKAGPGEDSIYDNDGNGPYCEECYHKAQDENPDLFNEDLDKNQKKAGQLGPTEKIGPKGAVGKLVGVSESVGVEEGTPEHEVIMDLINGNLDAYDVMNHPRTPAQQKVAAMMQERYDDIAGSQGFYDDDFEKILNKIVDELADDYDTSGYTQAMSEGKKREYEPCSACDGDGADEDGNVCEKCLGTGDDESAEINEGQEDLDLIKRLIK